MPDPLAQVVGLLQPNASFSKLVIASGAWAMRRSDDGRPFYCAVLEGAFRLSIAGREPITLEQGDFVLLPESYDFTASSLEAPPKGVALQRVEVSPGVFRIGSPDAPPTVRMLVGHCAFGANDAKLLVSLLPQLVHVHGQGRLTTLVEQVNGETRANRPGRDVVLSRLLEVLLIEALRSTTGPTPPPGLLRGLADDHLAVALRGMHDRPTRGWTVVELAREAGLSRSTFFERFRREVGVTPMEYLLAWRMALAKDLLRREKGSVAKVAERVGYSSASTFSVAFSRHVGIPPIQYMREHEAGLATEPDESGAGDDDGFWIVVTEGGDRAVVRS
jgi:AraC-like DNA-binding protein